MDGTLATSGQVNRALPHEGHRFAAANKRFQETIVFLHHFGGNWESTRRHQHFVGDLGFDCVSLTLSRNRVPQPKDFIDFPSRTWMSVWIQELKEILDLIPGRKILFSFSTPSVAALGTIVTENRSDIAAWICDGGPFLHSLHCLGNYLRYQTKTPAALILPIAWLSRTLMGGVNFETTISNWIRHYPAETPVLSVRCGEDRLVPLEAAAQLFDVNPNVPLQVLQIPEADHLEGLRLFPKIYEPAVSQFLTKHARSV